MRTLKQFYTCAICIKSNMQVSLRKVSFAANAKQPSHVAELKNEIMHPYTSRSLMYLSNWEIPKYFVISYDQGLLI